MLRLIQDFRTGVKLEIVIPTFNEHSNIQRLIYAYKDIADVVLIDDNSTDDTVLFAEQNKCTVFQRTRSLEPTKFAPTEYAIYYYSENLSKSNKIVKIDADEMITYSTIDYIFKALDLSDIILGIRNDVIGGSHYKKSQAMYPLGFKSKSIECIDRLHSAIQPKNDKVISQISCINYHLDIVVDNERFGKVGKYTMLEIDRLNIVRVFSYRFLRRFIVPVVLFLPRNFMHYNSRVLFYFFVKLISEFLVAIILISNRNIFGSLSDQISHNNNFFYKNFSN